MSFLTTSCQVSVEILRGEAADPAALRRIDPELAPFYCPDCGQNYCRADWRSYVVFDEGFYDGTMGRCPAGAPAVTST